MRTAVVTNLLRGIGQLSTSAFFMLSAINRLILKPKADATTIPVAFTSLVSLSVMPQDRVARLSAKADTSIREEYSNLVKDMKALDKVIQQYNAHHPSSTQPNYTIEQATKNYKRIRGGYLVSGVFLTFALISEIVNFLFEKTEETDKDLFADIVKWSSVVVPVITMLSALADMLLNYLTENTNKQLESAFKSLKSTIENLSGQMPIPNSTVSSRALLKLQQSTKTGEDIIKRKINEFHRQQGDKLEATRNNMHAMLQKEHALITPLLNQLKAPEDAEHAEQIKQNIIITMERGCDCISYVFKEKNTSSIIELSDKQIFEFFTLDNLQKIVDSVIDSEKVNLDKIRDQYEKNYETRLKNSMSMVLDLDTSEIPYESHLPLAFSTFPKELNRKRGSSDDYDDVPEEEPLIPRRKHLQQGSDS